MANVFERRLVKALQEALSNGPVEQDALLGTLRQAGLRVDSTTLYLTCATHSLADLHDSSWVPRGWAPPMAESAEVAAPLRQPLESPEERRAAAYVRRLASSIGITMDEPAPPVGPVPADWPRIAEQAVRALNDELHAVTGKRTLQDVPVSGGFVVAETSSRQLMRFEVEGDLGVSEGMQATLVAAGVASDVEIVSVFGNVVTLSLRPDAKAPSEAVLRCDLTWLLSSQSKRLRELANGGPGFNGDAAMALLSTAGRAAVVEDLSPAAVDGLNEGQRYAVRLGLTPGVTWLWGPPGTGKTTTVAVLVAELCRRGLRVLLTAPTNAAVDVAVRATLKRLPELADGRLVRLGQPSDAQLIARSEGHVLIDEIAARRGEAFAKARVQAAQRIRTLRARLKTLVGRHADLSADEQTLRLRLELDLADTTAIVRALDSSLHFVRRQVCREAQVVAATSHQVVLRTLRELTFDVVILDEASMTPTALALLVAGAGGGHTIVTGDFRQLPPVVIADTPAARDWLRHSPFEKAAVDVAVRRGAPPQRLAALTQQYRMRDDINHAVSEAFYPESPLVTAPVVTTRPRDSRAAWTAGELLLLDTSTFNARTARKQGLSSRYNLMCGTYFGTVAAWAIRLVAPSGVG